MRLVAVGATAASGAVQDYYRAFTQRSKWVREDLLLDEEAEGYDKVLIDAMQRECEAVLDDRRGRQKALWPQNISLVDTPSPTLA